MKLKYYLPCIKVSLKMNLLSSYCISIVLLSSIIYNVLSVPLYKTEEEEEKEKILINEREISIYNTTTSTTNINKTTKSPFIAKANLKNLYKEEDVEASNSNTAEKDNDPIIQKPPNYSESDTRKKNKMVELFRDYFDSSDDGDYSYSDFSNDDYSSNSEDYNGDNDSNDFGNILAESFLESTADAFFMAIDSLILAPMAPSPIKPAPNAPFRPFPNMKPATRPFAPPKIPIRLSLNQIKFVQLLPTQLNTKPNFSWYNGDQLSIQKAEAENIDLDWEEIKKRRRDFSRTEKLLEAIKKSRQNKQNEDVRSDRTLFAGKKLNW